MSIFDLFKKKPAPEPVKEVSKVKVEPKPRKPRAKRVKAPETTQEPETIYEQTANPNEPFVKIVSFDVDLKNPSLGSIELDWNQEFIEMLKTHGYTGNTNDEIINQWFTEVCRTISTEVPYMDSVSKYVQRRDMGGGKTEVS